jgi:hypothetical protein
VDVIREIMPGDPMYEHAPELYSKVGEDAVGLIREARSQIALPST